MEGRDFGTNRVITAPIVGSQFHSVENEDRMAITQNEYRGYSRIPIVEDEVKDRKEVDDEECVGALEMNELQKAFILRVGYSSQPAGISVVNWAKIVGSNIIRFPSGPDWLRLPKATNIST